MIELDKIYCQDRLIGMKDIPDGSIDCIICDLPYEVLHKNNDKVQWDRIIPFEPLWEQYLRIAKPNAAIVLFCQGMFTAQLMMSQPDLWKYNLIWEKGRATGFLNANRMPMRSHEDIAVFYHKQPTYNPQFRDGDSHPRGNGVHKQTNQCYGEFKEVRKKVGATYDYEHIKVVPPTSKCFPHSVLHFNKEHGADTFHPTQKPVDLIRYLVRTYSNEGDTILDNCSGSGTTAVAAWREKRHFICFEKDHGYWEKSVKRLEKELAQLSLFCPMSPYYIKKKPKVDENGNIIYSSLKRKSPLKPVSDKKKAEVDNGVTLTKKKAQQSKKPRQKSLATLVRELDIIFSKFIRLRDSKPYGFKYCKCISCGQVKPFDHFDAGHYYSRTKYSTRWDEKNVWAECTFCNRFSADHLIGYRAHLIERIGQREYDLLQFRANQPSKIANFEIEQLIKYYKAKTEQLIEESKPKSGLIKKKIGE